MVGAFGFLELCSIKDFREIPMTLTDKFELVTIAEKFGLDLTIQPNGLVSIGKWNGYQFEWYLIKLSNQPVDTLFEQLNKQLSK